MAPGILHPIGSEYGPCLDTNCDHKDCQQTRKMADVLCSYCTKRIGYERGFYMIEDNILVHSSCLENRIDEEKKERENKMLLRQLIFYVEKEETCPVCHGAQLLTNPCWTDWYKKNTEKPLPDAETLRQWFEDNGWHDSIIDDLRVDTNGVPYLMIHCERCDGEGDLVSKVDLRHAIDLLTSMAECEAISKRRGIMECVCGFHVVKAGQ